MSLRIRQVKPDFWRDPLLAQLTDYERLFYIGLWMVADDGGWLRKDIPLIAAELYPYRPRRNRETLAAKMWTHLAMLERIVEFECGHARIPKLADHQHLAGTTRRVYTVGKEHEACEPRGTAGARGDEQSPRPESTRPRPVRLGQVRKGQVNALARKNGAEQSTDPLAVAVAAIALHDSGEAPLSTTAEAAMRRTIKRHEPQP